ncbi:tRNA synthetases class I, catalytic domain-containing protein [Lipomyces arxii]|uniref:tRNA synthetases class I, catalytic domain-containing protein n=1 Tax=Lipomyces arxii TaxID=56418 RepID=UPI0034CE2920
MARLQLIRLCLTRRAYSIKSSKSASSLLAEISQDEFNLASKTKASSDVQPKAPVRTRFAPSPTGFLHIGSLRTALFNYLLAKTTNGQFILRIEDTDQTRKKEGAEENIYDSLKWAGIDWDEGPTNSGPYGPYRQSKRLDIYSKYAERLIESGHAYRCFCSKNRLDKLRDSARSMTPPSMASYDRHCYHLRSEEVDELVASGQTHTIRLKSPAKYPRVTDLLHGDLDMQVQVNYSDTRYDDPVLMKSDGYPTYHLANVVDDNAMKITHVIRGEEWLPSTPKHLALYDAFGWQAPSFVHIPLLTSLEDKKLSKRTGDIGVNEYMKSGILPEALVNFVALFGWYPPAEAQGRQAGTTEIFSMEELIEKFNLNGLTKGNVKVSESKLAFLNSHYMKARISKPDELARFVAELKPLLEEKYGKLTNDKSKFEPEYIAKVIKLLQGRLSGIYDVVNEASYIYNDMPDWGNKHSMKYVENLSLKNHGGAAVKILEEFVAWWNSRDDKWTPEEIDAHLKEEAREKSYSPSVVFQSIRFAVSGSVPGAPLSELMSLLNKDNVTWRAVNALRIIKL